MRRGEVLGLRWTDVDLDAGMLVVRAQLQRQEWEHGCSDPTVCGKASACPMRYGGGLRLSAPKSAKSQRTIPLPPLLIGELRAHRATQAAEKLASTLWVDNDLVVAGVGGVFREPRNDVRSFQALCARAKVPVRPVHAMRHTMTTLGVRAGVTKEDLGQMLGHTRPEMTDRYIAYVAEQTQTTAARIEDYLHGFTRQQGSCPLPRGGSRPVDPLRVAPATAPITAQDVPRAFLAAPAIE